MSRPSTGLLPTARKPPRYGVLGPLGPQAVWAGARWWAKEIVTRIVSEFLIEWPLLKKRWRVILLGAVWQYVHGLCAQAAYVHHIPQSEPLYDMGFNLLPEIGPNKFWISEVVFYFVFGSGALWVLSPFVLKQRRFYTIVVVARMLVLLSLCQMLRSISFLVTGLPGPGHHCRSDSPTAVVPTPRHWYQYLLYGSIAGGVKQQMERGCGDLIFSSHTTFVLNIVLFYNAMGSHRALKVALWLSTAVISILIIASRKHYTVDVVVAWYTVPLVFYHLRRRWTTHRPIEDYLTAEQIFAYNAARGMAIDTHAGPPEKAGAGRGYTHEANGHGPRAFEYDGRAGDRVGNGVVPALEVDSDGPYVGHGRGAEGNNGSPITSGYSPGPSPNSVARAKRGSDVLAGVRGEGANGRVGRDSAASSLSLSAGPGVLRPGRTAGGSSVGAGLSAWVTGMSGGVLGFDSGESVSIGGRDASRQEDLEAAMPPLVPANVNRGVSVGGVHLRSMSLAGHSADAGPGPGQGRATSGAMTGSGNGGGG